MKKIFLFLSFFLIFFTLYAVPLPLARAQDTAWVINRFDSDSAILSSGIVDVKETIVVDFKNLEKHGIYRDIPYVYENLDGSLYYTEIHVSDILQDDQKATYKVFKNGSFIRMQIGDADKTISRQHTYVISYSAKGILQRVGAIDELYWNVTGYQWGVPIEKVTARVTLPQDGIVQLGCYEGLSGSKSPCIGTKVSEKIAVFASTRPLGPSEGMTVALGYTKGMIPILTVARPKELWEKVLEPGSLLLFATIFFGGLFWIISTWYSKGRDLKIPGMHDTIVVEFTPPEKLRPAELGILMDEKADTLDVTATIIDLTTGGYMTITEIAKKWVFGSTDYELGRTEKSDSDLLSYEKMLLTRIFGSTKQKKVSTLKNDFYDDLAKIKDEMYDHMMKKGVFVAHPQKTRTTYTLIGVFIGIAGFGGIIWGGINEYAYLLSAGFALLPVALVTLIFSRMMSRRTAKGREMHRRVKGYREFINTAEKYRQRFFEKQNLFQEVLPYAIVFGLTGKFANAMKEIGLKSPTIAGYYGIHPFNPHSFTNDVNAFSNSFSSAAASTPSSSGSGGGGSSGGGFGGGGGGSW